MNKRKKIVIIICIVLAVPLIFLLLLWFRNVRTVLDEPRTLSAKEETITVCYVNWACDCADFIAQKNMKDKIQEDSCFFIEPADSSLKVPENFYDTDRFHKALVLTGRFYMHKGIPRSYEQKTEEKPGKARVFRYTVIKMVEKE